MALAAPILSAAIRLGLLSNPSSSAVDNAALTALCDEIAKAVVAHITEAGVVSVATACAAGSGTGTGTMS
ncbi:MAG: hypothetical protein FWD73_06895 [Polyangiaceae bacterium]|nr:hypothetical protein [Polyangiaceae bacterium]